MFGLFKRKKTVKLISPAKGKLIPITEVKDDMFSKKIMGDGYAVLPSSDDFYSPITGEIKSIFRTKHAITFETKDGLDVLMHLGIDTVELKGKPFELKAKAGQQVQAGDFLGTMDRKEIANSGLSDTIIVVFTNMDKIKTFPLVKNKSVENGDEIGTIDLN